MFEKITDNVEIHQTLPDTPNLTTQELKITWDKGCRIIKGAFNKLVDKLNEMGIVSTVLYESSTGTTDDITLSETIENFKYLEVFYGDSSSYMFQKIYSPNGKKMVCPFHCFRNNEVYTQFLPLVFSGTSVTREKSYYFSYNTQGEANSNGIKVFKVIGYK